ncbi:hypothetical protein SAMN05421540_102144 [Psychroflexus halocasei]|uniref:YdbS-like PH domain-containing protein n=1 Tax=Psychroflexus halocasei TaxID=908615 RepID=A0A1H3WU76_9FLAO|nr:hypothetical protein SAMN05421540_102144 [Psychroflexus halocasei]
MMFLLLNIKTLNALTSLNNITDQEFENVSLDISNLPDFKAVDTQGLNKRYLIFLRSRLLLFFVLYLTAAGLIYFLSNIQTINLILVLGVPFVIFLISFIEIEMGFHKRQVGVREHDLYYARGFLYHKETLVPFKNIQHVEVSQNLILKWFKLYEVIFYTAGASSGDLKIKGLDEQTSRRLKAIVMHKNESVEEGNQQL